MSYPSFPSIAYPSMSPTAEQQDVYQDNKISSPVDGGYTISRPRYSRSVMGGTYIWVAMSNSDYALFKAFVLAYYASIFVWTDEDTQTQINMQFTAPPKASKTLYGYWHVEISIIEA
jgi:hypothetical protein